MTSPKIVGRFVNKVVLLAIHGYRSRSYPCLLVACIVLYAQGASAQVVTLCQGFEADLTEIPVPGSVYVGDENTLEIYPGSSQGQRLATIQWTLKLTAPSGVTKTLDPVLGQDIYTLMLGQLGSLELRADFTYAPDYFGGPIPPPSSATVTINVTPPTGVIFNAQKSPAANTVYNINNGGDYYWFHIQGGTTNNGYHMMVEEKITITVPAGLGAQFGGQWAWNQGADLGIPNNAQFLNMATDGSISDLKSITNTFNDATVPNGKSLLQYTQTLGVKVQNMDGTISDITLGTFTFTATRVDATTCTFSITQ